MDTAVEQAREALARCDWAAAYDLLAGATGEGADADTLEALGDAAWWTSRIEECIAARERAYTLREEAGDRRAAASLALHLFENHSFRARPAAASGWLGRARRLLAEEPECRECGALLVREAEAEHSAGDVDRALETAERAVEIARRLGDLDLEAQALQATGQLLIAAGRPTAGLAAFDEAMVLATQGRLGPLETGRVYCSLIGACEELSDYRRAAEWTDFGSRWSQDHPRTVFPGLCRLHRATVLQLRGEWTEAEEEARRAYTELCDVNVVNSGAAFYEIGEIRRRLGDIEGAEEAFQRADELGCQPQPGLALLRLAQGRVDAAATSIARVVSEETWNRLTRAKLLPAQVEIAIAADDLDRARAATEELEATAEEFESPGLRAAASLARGRLELAGAEPQSACAALRRALEQWQNLDVPYEVASARVLLGRACREAGDEEAATSSLDAATAIFERLGAAPDAERARALRIGTPLLPGGLTEREAEVLRLVAAGGTNKDVAAQLFLSEKTVARHLSNIFAKIGVSTRSAATAYAFEHGLVGASR
ncbi:MAG TPA: LuxR C-terminal-related transcriptional regulator [Acidimicrobiia bacterium]|nr:LuxR C-terminal-related transcriptional regulator [Acidimicrobiia bacterium]